MIIGFDAKRIVSNGTGLGSYGRTLINDLAQDDSLSLRLYAPNSGRTSVTPVRDFPDYGLPSGAVAASRMT